MRATSGACSRSYRPWGLAPCTPLIRDRAAISWWRRFHRKTSSLLIPHLSSVQLAQGTVLAEPGVEVDHAYFPLSGAVSLLVVMRDGKAAIETGTVGREGVIGAMSGIAPCKWQVRAIAQLPMLARKIASTEFRKAVSSSKAIADLCLHCNEGLLTQAQIGAACNALHQIEARFCRCLLQTSDRAESQTIMLTQAFLAQMLGVRRTSVTEMASKIQVAGAISYSRGVIKIIDLDALRAMACECYETLREQTSLVGASAAQPRAGR